MEDSNSGRLAASTDVAGGPRVSTALLATAALPVAAQARGAAPAVPAAIKHADPTGDLTSVTMADDGVSPGEHANFKVSAKGEAVVLSDADGNRNTLIDAENFAALGEDEAYGRSPNGSSSFRTLSATPGAANLLFPRAIEAEGNGTEDGTARFTITSDPSPLRFSGVPMGAIASSIFLK